MLLNIVNKIFMPRDVSDSFVERGVPDQGGRIGLRGQGRTRPQGKELLKWIRDVIAFTASPWRQASERKTNRQWV